MLLARHSLLLLIVFSWFATPARSTFHFMQVELLTGGVCGRVDYQAIQLRMRAAGQNELGANARLFAYDATGANPVLLLDFPSNVSLAAAGSRVLVTSSGLANDLGIGADFTLTTSIPPSYLAAGRLTFEDQFGTIYWSVSWGGAAYTGSTTGSLTNDADGNFGPPFAAALPSSTSRGLLFGGSFSAASTNNAADYAVSDLSLTNNANSSFSLPPCIFGDGLESGDAASWSSVVP
jgi:hypothetical protein